MKYKMLYGILIFCVSVLMLMPNALAAGGPPYVWAAQATLSTVDGLPSQDPENSGFGTTQVTVWEEWNGADWDIYMKYSLLDGALLSWIFPPIHPAITAVDEINPAVSVTRSHRVFGQEIHVVYQSWNAIGGFWEIMHTYTANFGVLWTLPVPISTPGVDSTNPACVYTEDQALVPPPPAGTPFVVQVVWEEALPGGGTQIMYRTHVYDPTWVPVRGYLPGILAVPFLIRGPPLAPGSSELPEIASTDERLTPLAYDFNFNIVWQETNAAGNWDIWYNDGTTTTSAVPPPPPPGIVIAVPGMLNALAPATVDHTDPDIAASQDYNALLAPQSYYFHVDWVKQTIGPVVITFDIEESYSFGGIPIPGSAAFSPPAPVSTGMTLAIPPVLFDNPTIATKLTSVPDAPIVIFETWFAWEDNLLAPAPTDIWYRVGTYTSVPAGFLYPFMPLAVRVPYVPNPGVSIEQNPELWNREDVLRPNPLLTHLVFDINLGPVGGGIEVEYIDP